MIITVLTRYINLFFQLFPLASFPSSLVQVLLSQIIYLVLLLSCLLQVDLSHRQLLIHALLISQIVVSQPLLLTSYCIFHPLWILLFQCLPQFLFFFLLSHHLSDVVNLFLGSTSFSASVPTISFSVPQVLLRQTLP